MRTPPSLLTNSYFSSNSPESPNWGHTGHLHWEMHTEKGIPINCFSKLSVFKTLTTSLFQLTDKAFEATVKTTET